ncbi:PREDICTED: pre-B-cell leukemia transcription factor-interacting protein 1 [Nanorana parkeri]|uniref:pre-B-cell leukemia transcription factor-interacting protein 1 n=1 Tax=Nanorana parkeri TaxID=125878 RepID=UPI000854E609|nr:PREDICTED: pre-B-cell leukemia transcription factor-interacting protein 1 [Nanorana parkeri]
MGNTESLEEQERWGQRFLILRSHPIIRLISGPEPTAVPEKEETGVGEVKGPESPPLQEPESPPPVTEIPSYQEPFEIPPEEPQSLGEEPSPGLRRRLGADLEEVSCSSSDDDVEGLRKRAARGTPPTSVGPTLRESIQQEEDSGFSLTVNKCIIAAVALLALAGLVFTGGLGGDEDLPQTVITRSAGGDKQPETIADIQEWLHQHADQFTGDPDSLQVMNDLLDKVAKENQEIRHIQAKLQAQKEELEVLLHGEDKATQESQQFRLTNENERLKEALLREETGHLFAKEELQTLQEKLETIEANNADKEGLTSENTQLEADLEASQSQIEGFLTQKETLVAESQMLRQELDKLRSLVASIRQDLDSMTSNTTEGGEEKGLQSQIMEMSSRLAMEAQRSETWEKTYVEHAQKRKELVGEEKKPFGRKEWKKGDKLSKGSDSATAGEQLGKPHFKHGKEHGKRWTEDGQTESQHEEWKGKKHEDKQQGREKKHRHWEGEKTGMEDKERHPHESEGWKDKGKDNHSKEPSHDPDSERNWKDKHSRHHHGEAGNGFHPRKGQKEFSEAHKHGEDRKREHGDKAHGKEHRHHDHNKFWKKLSDHQYRVPEGCSGLEDCARKDGIDLFNVDLKPVQRKRFEEILQNYLTKSDLSKHLPELVPLLDGFFDGPYFSHHKIRFKDFVDDVEDFLEDLAKKETGDDDLVDDFERFVYTSFFGDAAIKKRSKKKDGHRKSYKLDRQHNPKKLEDTSESELNQTNPNYTNKKGFKVDGDNHNSEPYKGKYKTDEKDKSPNHYYDEDRNGHGWKNHKKYDKDGKYHQKSHQETSGHYFNQTRDSVHEMGEWHHKKPKYNTKDHNHGYRSYHEDYHDRKEDGKHFHEQKPYKKREEHKDGQGHHYHKNQFDTEDLEHPRGKHRHEHKHKNSPSFVDHNEDTEKPFHHEHKPYGRKQEKNDIIEYYRSPDGHHHGNKPWKEGGDQRHEHKPLKQG